MPRRVSSDKCIRVLCNRFGFRPVRQRGSHVVLRHADGRQVVVPAHQELRVGTVHSILDQAGISMEAFVAEL